MCGRYERNVGDEEIIRQFEIDEYLDFFANYRASQEVFPGTPILAINNKRQPEDLWWTIRDQTWNGKMASAINAKSENITRTPMFRDAFKEDRVLIPATGIYEWQVQPDDSKKKFKIWFDEPLFALAGIARDCEIKGETKRCTVIITTEPNEIFAEIHNAKQRQAVVIKTSDYEKWLDPKTKIEDLKAMMRPLPTAETHFEEAKPKEEQGGLFDL